MQNYKKIRGNLVHETAIINWNKLKIGRNNLIGPYVIIGENPQHPREKPSGNIYIGSKNVIREFSKIFLPTKLKKKTVINNNCYFMSSNIIDHDCYIEDNVVLSSNVILGGNVYIMKKTQLGIKTIVHQNQVLGSYSMFGMGSIITKKLIAYPGKTYFGSPAKKIKTNKLLMKRENINNQLIKNENIRFNKLKKNW